jgi:hypothetical protein
MTRIRPFALVVIAAAAGWAVARGTAQPPAKHPADDVIPRPEFIGRGLYTAFPELTVPLTEDRSRTGRPLTVPDEKKMFARLHALLARPVPADAPPLAKVRVARVYEGAWYLLDRRKKLYHGSFKSGELGNYIRTTTEVYQAAAEFDGTPAGRIGLTEDLVRLLKEAEQYAMARTVTEGPPEDVSEATFYRLRAEADLLTLKDELAAAAGPQQVYCVPAGPTRGGILRRR